MKRPKKTEPTAILTTRLPQRCPACGTLALTVAPLLLDQIVTCARPCGWSAWYRVVETIPEEPRHPMGIRS